MSRPRTYDKQRRVTIVMEDEDYKKLKEEAVRRGLTFSRMAALVLLDSLGDDEG